MANVYLSTTNYYNVPSTAIYTVTVPHNSQNVSVNHTFYISDDSLNSYCTANYNYSVQYPDSSTISFTDQSISTSANLNYFWSFGDGTSTLQNPTHTYTSNGIYLVTLTISNALTQPLLQNNIHSTHMEVRGRIKCVSPLPVAIIVQVPGVILFTW